VRRHRLNQIDNGLKMDSVNDFLSALHAGTRDGELYDDIYEGQHTGNMAADSWIKAFGGSSGGSSRRWVTAPSPGLATIREDGGDDEEHLDPDKSDSAKQIGPLDHLNSEIRPSTTSVRQFRVPRRTPKSEVSKREMQVSDSTPPTPPSGGDRSFDVAPEPPV